ncbi:MAG: hypothetical protein R8K47_01890, partial [Mariprofundaceae bacterium]
DWKVGADALSVEWRLGAQGSIRLVHAPGDLRRGLREKSVLRWRDTFGETDLAVMAGRIGSERVAGLDLTGNLGDAAARLEWLQSSRGPTGDWGQVAVGLDGTLTPESLPNGLHLAAEYFHNGAAARRPLFPDRLTSLARHLLAFAAGYDITPLWRLEFATILDPAHGGWFAQPALRWSASEAWDVQLLVQRAGGPPGSDFGGGGTILLLRLDGWLS